MDGSIGAESSVLGWERVNGVGSGAEEEVRGCESSVSSMGKTTAAAMGGVTATEGSAARYPTGEAVGDAVRVSALEYMATLAAKWPKVLVCHPFPMSTLAVGIGWLVGTPPGTDAAEKGGTGAPDPAGAFAPEAWNTFNELTLQYASLNAEGLFCTKSLQVCAFEEHTGSEFHTLPAQSPQKVVSNTI